MCFQLSIVEVCPEVQPRSDVRTLTVNEKCLVATGCIVYIRPATSATLKVPFV